MSLMTHSNEQTVKFATGADVFPEALGPLHSEMAWMLDAEQQLDLLQLEMLRTQIRRSPRIKTSRAKMMKALQQGK